jgi:hypothetical protein
VGSVPTGGTQHCGSVTSGSVGSETWSLWSNTVSSSACVTTYGSAPAFSASWGNNGDFLARFGKSWSGSSAKPTASQYTITAQFAETKMGTGGGYSYIGIYGWSLNPCIEWYIVDDSYARMPVNPGNATLQGTATIDGGTYNLYTRPTTGTGGNECGSVTSWTQYYSVRQTARTCGQISITQHFNAWAAKNMTLGTLNDAQITVEVGGGTGSVDFATASMTAQ